MIHYKHTLMLALKWKEIWHSCNSSKVYGYSDMFLFMSTQHLCVIIVSLVI